MHLFYQKTLANAVVSEVLGPFSKPQLFEAIRGLVTINHANWGTGASEAWNFNINTYPYTHDETGMEILNGSWDDTNRGSTTRWIDQRLLKGEKVFPFAGSDTESTNHFARAARWFMPII